MGKNLLRELDMATCSKGTGPGAVSMVIAGHVKVDGRTAGTCLDILVSPCGECISTQNPAVAAAEGAPVPCTPLFNGLKWDKASKSVTMNKLPAIHTGSSITCAFGGKVTVKNASATHVTIGK